MLPYFGNTLISRITPHMLDVYKQMRAKQGASNNTVNHDLTNLSHMLRMAIRWGYIDRNVVSLVDKMKVPKRSPRFLHQEEIRRLAEAAIGSHIYPLIVTALHTGMRKAELFNLKWSDIDFDNHTVTIQPKDDWHTKNYKPRSLQLTPALHEVLREHWEMKLIDSVRSEYVFTYKGRQLKSNIKWSFATVLKKASLENVSLHTLRHTFASQLVMAGVPLREIQELMGHQSFETTLQYAHLSEDHVKQQVMKLPFASNSAQSRTRIGHAKPILADNLQKERTL